MDCLLIQPQWDLRIFLPNDTPILGCQIKLRNHVNIKGSLSSPGNFHTQFNWYRSQQEMVHHTGLKVVEKDGKSWVHVGSSTNYTPSVHDIGSVLRIEAVAVDDDGIAKSAVSVLVTSPTLAPPPHYHRCMIDFRSSPYFRHVRSCKDFKVANQDSKVQNCSVLSYNILADMYVNSEKYYYCPTWALTWEYRRQNLACEIIGYDPDVICIQEMQSDHLEDFFKPEFEKYGYSVVYKSKTHHVHINGDYTSNGCAVFYRRSRFTLVVQYEVELGKFALPIIEELEPRKKKDAFFKLMKDNVAIAVILEENSSTDDLKSRICVANTHLHADPRNPEVKLLQATSLIKGLEKIGTLQIPTIICGDMNSLPSSHPHRFITTGSIETPKKSTDIPNFYDHLKLNHSMNLASAYSTLHKFGSRKQDKVDNHHMEPSFTSITPRFKGTLDYIFYTENMLEVDALLEPLDDQSLGEVPLPSPLWSSDHIALLANFRVSRNLLQNPVLPLDLWD